MILKTTTRSISHQRNRSYNSSTLFPGRYLQVLCLLLLCSEWLSTCLVHIFSLQTIWFVIYKLLSNCQTERLFQRHNTNYALRRQPTLTRFYDAPRSSLEDTDLKKDSRGWTIYHWEYRTTAVAELEQCWKNISTLILKDKCDSETFNSFCFMCAIVIWIFIDFINVSLKVKFSGLARVFVLVNIWYLYWIEWANEI